MHTVLESIATANPPFQLSQADSLTFMSQLEGLSPPVRARLKKIYAKSGIDCRYTCIQDYLTAPPNFSFYPDNWHLTPLPSTAVRNQLYQSYAPKIAESAASQAIQQARLNPTSITHLIIISCTGFSAPGLDVQLIQQLGLRADVDRTIIGFMGCYAAFNGLKTAHAICQSDPHARVLLVCVELCTLHFQPDDSLESVVINALFGDGAAAAIISAQSDTEAVGKLAYVDGYSLLTNDTLELMSWTIGNTGFLMTLSPQVSQAIARYLPAYLTTLLDRNNLAESAIDFWAVHPGGRLILDQVHDLLQLAEGTLQSSYEVLRQYGNMSSGTILFVLKQILSQQTNLKNGIAMAFGPGLTIEGCLFQQVGA
ncbi:type III polyketide synthase [Leptolyngbyaceae cyanobacterium CCMR0082]|uniref:Type III polyketide synthase n=1 Tax=Adonisia turfae CCMR0082 TaxID=2304604 RepID=A0A6M0S448_9CYAN|nr:type III polyketide synthase [Adonisia turfae]MDV3351640.1 type III polyketide synthase [Leptothoe sp. LEGE 181152]NEZ63090.1 type III polyketide synthase [Adonisia turfae CCMR0082]